MAELHGTDLRIYGNGVDTADALREGEFGRTVPKIDTSSVGITADTHTLGSLTLATLSAGGKFLTDADLTPHLIEEMLQAAAGTGSGSGSADNVITIMARDTTVGDPGLAMVGSICEHRTKQVMREIVETSFAAQSSARSGWCRALHAKAARTAANNGSRLDNGASTTNGGFSVLHVFAMSGTAPVLRFKTQEDDNDDVWVDLATHTDVTMAMVNDDPDGHAEVITVAGDVQRGLRSNLSIVSGTLTSVTFALAFVRYP